MTQDEIGMTQKEMLLRLLDRVEALQASNISLNERLKSLEIEIMALRMPVRQGEIDDAVHVARQDSLKSNDQIRREVIAVVGTISGIVATVVSMAVAAVLYIWGMPK